jgi:hypothetical protein
LAKISPQIWTWNAPLHMFQISDKRRREQTVSDAKVGSAIILLIVCIFFSQPHEIFTLHLLVVINQQRPEPSVGRGPVAIRHLSDPLFVHTRHGAECSPKHQFMHQRDNDVCRFSYCCLSRLLIFKRFNFGALEFFSLLGEFFT